MRSSRPRVIADHFKVITADVIEYLPGLLPVYRVRGHADLFVVTRPGDSEQAIARIPAVSRVTLADGVAILTVRAVDGVKPARDPATMTTAQIHTARERLRAPLRDVLDVLIAAGRGSESQQETRRLAQDGDLLAVQYVTISDRMSALNAEIDLRVERGSGAGARLKLEDPSA